MSKIETPEVIEAGEGISLNLHDHGRPVRVVCSDIKLFEAGEAAKGQGRNPPDLAAVQIKGLEIWKISEMICSENRLVEENI